MTPQGDRAPSIPLALFPQWLELLIPLVRDAKDIADRRRHRMEGEGQRADLLRGLLYALEHAVPDAIRAARPSPAQPTRELIENALEVRMHERGLRRGYTKDELRDLLPKWADARRDYADAMLALFAAGTREEQVRSEEGATGNEARADGPQGTSVVSASPDSVRVGALAAGPSSEPPLCACVQRKSKRVGHDAGCRATCECGSLLVGAHARGCKAGPSPAGTDLE